MNRSRVERVARKVVMALIFIPIVLAGFGWAVWGLWNWLMPQIFGLPTLTFWQAAGLLGLTWLLFGRFRMGGGHHGGGGWQRRQWIEKWEKMTPEEREEFKKKVEGRCGKWSHHEGDIKTP